MLNIVTKELSIIPNKLHKLLNYQIVDPQNFNQMLNLLKSTKQKSVSIYDVTMNKKIKYGQHIIIKDHINKTGQNILLGKQKTLKIDFIDMTDIYTCTNEGIITICCGTKLFQKIQYPSHYLCHISTLAHALNFNVIKGYLVNIAK